MAVTPPPQRGTLISRAGSPAEATEADLRALESNILTTTVDRVVSWARRNSLWPAQFGLACCAIEMIATAQARFDIARFGSEAFRASPRQADLMIVSGRVSQKMAPVVKHIYEQMLDPKWVIAMGDCASCGGVLRAHVEDERLLRQLAHLRSLPAHMYRRPHRLGRPASAAYACLGFDVGMIWLGTFGVWPRNSTGSSTSG